MELPEGYLDSLGDELAPFGLSYDHTEPDDDGGVQLCFIADADSFVHAYPEAGIAESHGSHWPVEKLELWVRIDPHLDPYDVSFENFDLMLETASTDPELHTRLNTLGDPQDQASAIGEALASVLQSDAGVSDDYME